MRAIEKIKCIVSYDGTRYKGFQRQQDVITIQGEIERALATIHKKSVTIHASGRTDAGVHAVGQVFHFESFLNLPVERWQMAINSLLPKDIHIRRVEKVDPSFHARYSAKAKEYRYYINRGEYQPLKENYCYQRRSPVALVVDRMKQAIKLFEGTHDFLPFTVKNEVENTVRTIYRADLIEHGDFLELIFIGSGFLRCQVRVMVGTLIEIGEGLRDESSVLRLFEGKEEVAGRTAPPQGLYLYRVFYDDVDTVLG